MTLCGWVWRRRDHGGVTFVDLRDRDGLVQLVFHPEDAPIAHAAAQHLGSETVVRVTGEVRERPAGTVNPDLPTGEVELRVSEAQLLSELLWEKFWDEGSLSNDWAKAVRGLVAYARERPEIVGRYRKIGSYLATKVLIADLRLGLWQALWRDLGALRAAGLVDFDVLRLIRDHRDVRRYRRAMSRAEELARLAGPPAEWR